MSTRSRSRSNDPEFVVLETYDSQGAVIATSAPQPTLVVNESMDDTVVPGYHKAIRDGEIINNPCLYTSSTMAHGTDTVVLRTQHNFVPSTYFTYGDTGNWTYEIAVVTPGLYQYNLNRAPSIDISKLNDIAKQKCLANVDSTPYDFMEDLGEISETLQFLRHPLTALKSMHNAFLKRRKYVRSLKIESKQKAKALAKLWNQYRFAAAPLYRSIMEGCEAFNNWDDTHRNTRRTAHGYSSEESEHVFNPVVQTGGNWVYTFKHDSVRELKIHAAIVYEVTNPLNDWKFKLGLRAKDIPTTAWELLPLSFMVDRLVDIKSSIAGLVNLLDPQVKILAGSVTKRDYGAIKLECINLSDTGGTWTVTIDKTDHFYMEDFEYSRSIWSPEYLDTVPRVTVGNVVDTISKTTDLLAILISTLLK